MVYIRANMIASGKMFVANMLPTSMIAFFDWNPLFHVIDQARGFVFVNYFPHYTNWQYPLYFTLVVLVLGFMAEGPIPASIASGQLGRRGANPPRAASRLIPPAPAAKQGR